jgi:hypothetical protein
LPFDGESDDTGEVVPPPPTDLDADGWSETDGDCDDADPAVHPGAYDRPDDGVDADCADGDRTCDCVVLDGGTTAVEALGEFDFASSRSLDLTLLLDTTCSNGGRLTALAESFPDIADALDTSPIATTAGLATFDDYAYGFFGGAAHGDKPFHLGAQQTDDLTLVQDALVATPLHGGGDGPEAAMEALYQALTGAGYDQDCDATYDTSTDVMPFVADAADPFGGAGGQLYDVTDPSTGTVGGVGFRADATVRVLMYATDNYMRDPSADYESPGGCPGDAGADDVAAAALASDVYLVGLAWNSSLPLEQMRALADATGSVADVDGDGDADDALVYSSEYTTTGDRDAILDALEAVLPETALRDVFGSVTLEVRDDPLGIVAGVSPDRHTNVEWPDVDALTFGVVYDTSAYGAKPVVGSVDFALVGDGFDLATVHVDVEIAPH